MRKKNKSYISPYEGCDASQRTLVLEANRLLSEAKKQYSSKEARLARVAKRLGSV